MKADEDSEMRYQSYLLRMWRRRDGAGQPEWCASLEEPGSHQTRSFGDMQALIAFLLSRSGLAPSGAPAPEVPPGSTCGRDRH